LISLDYAENWPEPVQRHLQRLMGDHLISACTTPSFHFAREMHAAQKPQTYSCDIPTYKTTSPPERPFSHYIHSHRLAAEMWTTKKNNLLGKQFSSCSFYLYRFRKYVSYGFPMINFYNPGVRYETPCILSHNCSYEYTRRTLCVAENNMSLCSSQEVPVFRWVLQLRTLPVTVVARQWLAYSIQLCVKNCLKFLDYMQLNCEISLSDLGYKVAYNSRSLDGLCI
jgi:hypothetical protein